uniref:uncharacterized protein LOC122608377 isoform X2 n=1 Tax=Erigeron canadensis TaxID=72917 RepID=UPI001CB91443|nr:uncharacterized protein LOC122608377 isoform X2 [Erigeron canadensis]
MDLFVSSSFVFGCLFCLKIDYMALAYLETKGILQPSHHKGLDGALYFEYLSKAVVDCCDNDSSDGDSSNTNASASDSVDTNASDSDAVESGDSEDDEIYEMP